MEEAKAQRASELEAATAATRADSPPIPRVDFISPAGEMKVAFSQPIKVPADYKTKVENSEVALRTAESRTETYLTENGYQDFQIRPSLDL